MVYKEIGYLAKEMLTSQTVYILKLINSHKTASKSEKWAR